MQNKANLQGGKTNINSYKTSNYRENRLRQGRKNKAKQTQFQTHRAALTSAESVHSASHLGYKLNAGPLAESVGLTNIGHCVLNQHFIVQINLAIGNYFLYFTGSFKKRSIVKLKKNDKTAF